MKKVKKLSLIIIMVLMLTGCGDNENLNGGIGNNKVEYYKNAETVYFNAETGKICSDYKEENSDNENTGGCLKWYLYSDNGDKTVNLLLDHNISKPIIWNTSDDMKNGPSKELLDTLKKETSDWSGVDDRKDKYSLDLGEINYTIDYKGYKARLISKEEIMGIISGTSIAGESNRIYFNKSTCKFDSGKTPDCEYGWLFDRTASNCKDYGCSNNSDRSSFYYWTSTAFSKNKTVWTINSMAYVYPQSADDTYSGTSIRPVITIKKSLVK